MDPPLVHAREDQKIDTGPKFRVPRSSNGKKFENPMALLDIYDVAFLSLYFRKDTRIYK